MEEPQEYLRIRNLKVGFEVFGGFVNVLDLSELDVLRRESYGLVGESGSGKTVLSLAILGLLPQPPAVISADEMRLAGVDLLKLRGKKRRAICGRQVSMIFQDPMSALDPVYVVGSQMCDVLRRRAGVGHGEALERARELMSLVELPDPETILGKYPHQLSGGQRQRVIIALALACGAEFLIADEPTRNLDVTVQASILKTLYHLRKELGVGLLFIANNLGLVSAICDRVGILLRGSVVETGTVRDVVDNPLHPYTHDLLHAVPGKGETLAGERVASEESVSEESASGPSGCFHFARCKARKPSCCNTEIPVLLPVSETHAVACLAVTPAVLKSCVRPELARS